jgi:serine protease Do
VSNRTFDQLFSHARGGGLSGLRAVIDRLRRRPWRRRAVATGAAICAAGSLTAWQVYGADTAVNTASSSVAAAVAPLGAGDRIVGDGADSYAPIVARVAPAVVTIQAERLVREAQQFPFTDDPLFRRFFGDRPPQPDPQDRRQGGLGSGVIVSPDGYILTNHHVVDGADEITVELTDRRSFTAKVVGTDAPSDLAVLDIEGSNFPWVSLGDSDQVRVGDIVLAVGNPMGVGQTVTMGIISAKGRATGLGDGSFEDFLQTDAPINRGNSGGALVNTRGELVGINSQILSPSGGNIGIGFAIPANMAGNVMQALITDGRVHRARLGVVVQPLTAQLARSLELDAISGALVSDVQPDGAAADAGVERGDVITKLNGQRVDDSNELRNEVASLKPGTKAEITVVRDGRERNVTVTLDELPSQTADAERGSGSPSGGAGLSVQPLTPEVARQLGVRAEEGLVVVNVDPSGPAADAGFRKGDVIRQVDGSKVESVADLRGALSNDDDRPALVLVQRGDVAIYLPLERGNT